MSVALALQHSNESLAMQIAPANQRTSNNATTIYLVHTRLQHASPQFITHQGDDGQRAKEKTTLLV